MGPNILVIFISRIFCRIILIRPCLSCTMLCKRRLSKVETNKQTNRRTDKFLVLVTEHLFLREYSNFNNLSYFGGPLLISLRSALETFLSSPGFSGANLGLRKYPGGLQERLGNVLAKIS